MRGVQPFDYPCGLVAAFAGTVTQRPISLTLSQREGGFPGGSTSSKPRRLAGNAQVCFRNRSTKNLQVGQTKRFVEPFLVEVLQRVMQLIEFFLIVGLQLLLLGLLLCSCVGVVRVGRISARLLARLL